MSESVEIAQRLDAIYDTELTNRLVSSLSSSPSYTLAEWKAQVFDYCDEWERETESTQTEFRLMLSLMFESLGKKEREANGTE